MAGKKESTYRYNAKMSMRNLSADLMSDNFSNTKNFIVDARAGYKAVIDTKNSSGFRGIKNRIKQTALFQFASDITKNAFEGLKTGKFYKSEDEVMGLEDYDFGEDFFFTDDSMKDWGTDAEKEEKRESSPNVNGIATYAAVGKMAESVKGSAKSSQKMMIQGFMQTANSINSTLVATSSDIKSQMLKNELYYKTMADSLSQSLSVQQKLLAVQTEMLTEHKALKLMLADYYLPKINKEDDEYGKNLPEWYNAIRKGEMGQGIKAITGEVGRAVDMTKFQGMWGLTMAMLPMISQTFGKNPFAALRSFFIDNKLDEMFGLKKISNIVERAFGSTQDFINKQARTASLSGDGVMAAAGKSLMVKPDVVSNLRTDKYEKKHVFFDGITREAIVTVIPTYLSSIASALTGNERTTYDYNKGQFKTLSSIRKEFEDNRPKLNYEYNELADMLKEAMSPEDRNNLDEGRLRDFSKIVMEELSKGGYTLTNFKEHDYNQILSNLNLSSKELSKSDFYKFASLMAKIEKDEKTRGRFQRLDDSMENWINQVNNFFREQSKESRNSGLIQLLNNSGNIDNGGAIGLKALLGGLGGANIPADKQRQLGFIYEHLMKNEGKFVLKNRDGLEGNILGTTLSDKAIESIDEYHKDSLSGLGKFKAKIQDFIVDMGQTALGEKSGVTKQEWFKNMVETNPYALETILGHQAVIDEIIGGKMQEEVLMTKLDEFDVTDKDKTRILDILTDSTKSQEDIKSEVKNIIYSSNWFKKKLVELKDTFQVRADVDIDGKVDKAKSIWNQTKDELKGVKISKDGKFEGIEGEGKLAEVRNKVENTAKSFKEKMGDVKEKAKNFYEDNKDTIWKASKAAMIGAAGIGAFKFLKKSMFGPIIGLTGLASPLALGALALGVGVYAYKSNLFERLFGDSEKAKEARNKMMRITKGALVAGGAIAGLSGILSAATPLGFIGPVNAALAGLAVSIAGESKGFRKMLFGTEEGTFLGNLKTWLIGDKESGKEGILTKATKGFTGFIKEAPRKMAIWFRKDIWKPLSQTFTPIKEFMSNTASGIFKTITGIKGELTGSFSNDFVKPFFKTMKEKVIDPIAGVFKKIFGGMFKFIGRIIAAPFKMFRTIITGRTDADDIADSKAAFASSHTSKTPEGIKNVEAYENATRRKEDLYLRADGMTDDDIQKASEFSDSDKKLLLKMRAKDTKNAAIAKRLDGQDVQEAKAKSLEERLADYKVQKALKAKGDEMQASYLKQKAEADAKVKEAQEAKAKEEEGQSGKGIKGRKGALNLKGVAKEIAKSIKSKVIPNLGGNGTLCGLSALALALSRATGFSIKPEYLTKKSFGWTGSTNGVPASYMMSVATKFGINATHVVNPKIGTFMAFMKGASSGNCIVVELSDFETDELHYIMIYNITSQGTVEYSDPDRKPDMTIDVATLEAHAKQAIFFKEKQMNTMSAEEKSIIGNMIAGAKDDEVGPKEAVVSSTTDENIKDMLDKGKKAYAKKLGDIVGKAMPEAEALKKGETNKEILDKEGINVEEGKKGYVNAIKGWFKNKFGKKDPNEDEPEVLDENGNPIKTSMLKKMRDGAVSVAQKIKGRIQAFDKNMTQKSALAKYLGKRSELYILLKGWRKKYLDEAQKLRDTINLQTSSLAYNAEYIKRILVRKYGPVKGFGNKNIKNKHFTVLGQKIAGAWRKVKALPGAVLSGLYNKLVRPVLGAVMQTLGAMKLMFVKFPLWIAKSVWKHMALPILSKMGSFVKGVFSSIKYWGTQMVLGARMLVSKIWGAMKIFGKTIWNATFGLAWKFISNFPAIIMGAADRIGTIIDKGLDKIGKGITWLVTSVGKVFDWIYQRGKDLVTGVWNILFGRSNKPNKVWVEGGIIDNVRVVEVVKAVGAVDLEYTESMYNKLGYKDDFKFAMSGKRRRGKSPKMKDGAEYSDIDKRQDKKDEKKKKDKDGNTIVVQQAKDGGGILGSIAGAAASMFGSGGGGSKFLGNIFTKLGMQGLGSKVAGGAIVKALPAIGALVGGGALVAFANSKYGEQYENFINSTGRTGETVTHNIQQTGFRVIKNGLFKNEAFKKGAQNVAERGVKQLTETAIGKWFKELIEKMLKKLTKYSLTKTFAEKLLKSKGIETVSKKMGKKAAKKAGKKTAKNVARSASYSLPPVGAIVDAAFAIYDFIHGWRHASSYFGIGSEYVTTGMKFAAGFVELLWGLASSKVWVLAAIPIDDIVVLFYEWVSGQDEESWKTKEAVEAFSKEEQEREKIKEEKEKAKYDAAKVDYDYQANFKNQNDTMFDVDPNQVTKDFKLDPEKAKKDMQDSKTKHDAEKDKPVNSNNGMKAQNNTVFDVDTNESKMWGNGTYQGFGPVTPDGKLTKVDTTTQEAKKAKSDMQAMIDDDNASKFGDRYAFIKNFDIGSTVQSLAASLGIDPNNPNGMGGDFSGGSSYVDPNVNYGSAKGAQGAINSAKARWKKKYPNISYEEEMVKAWNFAVNKIGLDAARDMFRISYSESKWDPLIVNQSQYPAAGLWQVVPSSRRGWGFDSDKDNPIDHMPYDQFDRVSGAMKKKMNNSKLAKGDMKFKYMYRALHLPASVDESDDWYYYSKWQRPSWYYANTALDLDKDGAVRNWEVERHGMAQWAQAEQAAEILGFRGFDQGIRGVKPNKNLGQTPITKKQQMGLQAGNEGFGPMKHVSQNSGRWNKLGMGGGLRFREAGCGPAVMAMLLDKLKIRYDMEDLVRKAVAMKTSPKAGTPMKYFVNILAEHKIRSAIFNDKVLARFVSELRQGRSPILLTVSSTGAPHFIIGKEMVNGKIYINDPEKNSSEQVSVNDKRLRMAKAILIYKEKASVKLAKKTASMVDIIKGAYGTFKEKVVEPVLAGYGRVSRDMTYNAAQEYTKTMNLSGKGSDDNVAKSSNSIALSTDKIKAGIQASAKHSQTQTGILNEINENLVKFINRSQGMEQNGETKLLEAILGELRGMNKLFATFIEAVTGKRTNLALNGYNVMTTVNGNPTPVTMGSSGMNSNEDFYRLIDRICKGKSI
ncbi:papain-like cysteine protease [Fusobacterium phage JD-Fnp1]|nr:papain-like cysteine protease [Fusobacterium phage JD-Fnp1]